MIKNNILALYLGFLPVLATAQNPIIQTKYTADPAPMVHNDTLFLYVGCDEKDAPSNAYLMREYRLYTTTDMVNWTDCGAPLKTSDFKWSAGDASAAQCIERDGKFYWYISSQNRFSPGSSIGVAVADTPYGPFRDALGQALVTNDMTTAAKHSWDDLDPTVFIDSNKQAYLYWGNGACYQAKLNKDMISLDSSITALDIKDQTAFVGRFTEAPWVYKRNNLYYMIYAAEFPESIHYSTSHDRIFFVEVMGRDAGFLAQNSAIASGAEAAIIPEDKTDVDQLETFIGRGFRKTKNSSIVIVTESPQNKNGGAMYYADRVKKEYPEYDVRVSILGHLQRGGAPSANDRILASRLGEAAIQALMEDQQNVMIGIRNNEIVYVPFAQAIKNDKPIDKSLIRVLNELSI